ncbi:MAG: hypothetical protein Q4E69_06070 [Bacilli bacterium]|nr:hypothetical protein [Bacilli bacterium]
MKKYLTRKNFFYAFIIILFLILSIIMCNRHEYWADEANAWLLAQDLSIKDLILYIHRDGHPILFHLVIKLFSVFGLKYDHFYIISIIFSTIGVSLLVIKSKFKWYLKLLLPFTYFIFYQYTVVVRGYCLALLLIGLIAILWEKRREKCVLFTFILFLLLSSEIYLFLLAGSIYLIMLIDYYKEIKKTKKFDKKYNLCLIFLFLAFLLTTIYVFPRESNTFNPDTLRTYFLSSSFITSLKNSDSIKMFMTMLLVVYFTLLYRKLGIKKTIEALIIIGPILIFMIFKYSNLWHFGIVFLVFLFIVSIQKLENNKYINILLLITCIIQIYYSINTCIYDYNNKYSASKDVANFIKKYNYSNLKIYGHTFYSSEISPYFENDLYFNYGGYRFYYWDKDASINRYRLTYNMLRANNVELFIYYPYEFEITDKIYENYNFYAFPASTYFQDDKYENMNCYVFVRKDIDKKRTR